MIQRFAAVIPLALALLVAPATLRAQEPAPATEPAPVEENGVDEAATAQMQAWLAEIQELNGRLQDVRQAALQDAELSAAQEAIGARVRAAMEEADSTLVTSMTRLQSLQAEAEAAQQQGNGARLEELGAEAREIEERFAAAQQQALSQPELSAEVQAFQTRLQAKILELEPEAPQLIARFQELQQNLSAALGGGVRP
jgi:DNA repair exonuclease SbcCD ATPase subunit